jgi:hypothetical protein
MRTRARERLLRRSLHPVDLAKSVWAPLSYQRSDVCSPHTSDNPYTTPTPNFHQYRPQNAGILQRTSDTSHFEANPVTQRHTDGKSAPRSCGHVADVTEAHTASIFKVRVSRVMKHSCAYRFWPNRPPKRGGGCPKCKDPKSVTCINSYDSLLSVIKTQAYKDNQKT